MKQFLTNEAASIEFGQKLARYTGAPLVLFLYGELGAGKTTIVRAMLRELGVSGAIKSPTFALIEPYELQSVKIFHFDLYRLQDPEELEYLGLRDYLAQDSICIFEWPQRGGCLLPPCDLALHLSTENNGRIIELNANSASGEAMLKNLQKDYA